MIDISFKLFAYIAKKIERKGKKQREMKRRRDKLVMNDTRNEQFIECIYSTLMICQLHNCTGNGNGNEKRQKQRGRDAEIQREKGMMLFEGNIKFVQY